jgi:hypothetical protein
MYRRINSPVAGVNRKGIPLDTEEPPPPGSFCLQYPQPRHSPCSRMRLGETNRVAFGHRYNPQEQSWRTYYSKCHSLIIRVRKNLRKQILAWGRAGGCVQNSTARVIAGQARHRFIARGCMAGEGVCKTRQRESSLGKPVTTRYLAASGPGPAARRNISMKVGSGVRARAWRKRATARLRWPSNHI